MIFSGFRFALNGFSLSGDDFRASSFWITLVLAYFGILGLIELWNHAPRKRILVVLLIEIALFVLSYALVGDYSKKTPAAITLIALVAYGAIFSSKRASASVLSTLIIIAACAELVAQSNPIINQVPIVTHAQYKAEYNDSLKNELDGIDEDLDGRYRVDYQTGLLARSLAQGYLGTQAYIGGTGLTQEQIDFLKAAASNDYVEQMGYSRYAYGFNDNNINTLLGVKYLVAANEGSNQYIPFGYSRVSDVDDSFTVYENAYALPFIVSYAYDEAISDDQLKSLPREYRGAALLKTCVVPDEKTHKGAVLGNPLGGAQILASSDAAGKFGDDAITVSWSSSDASYLIAVISLSSPLYESSNIAIDITFENDYGTSIVDHYLTAGGNERILLPVENKGFTSASAQVKSTNLCDGATISDLAVYALPDSYYDSYLAAVADKLSENPKVSQIDNNLVRGSLTMADDGFIVTSIPWSDAWHVYVDGKESEALKVNYGFIGGRGSCWLP